MSGCESVGRQPSMRSSFEARSIRFSMSRIDSRYSAQLDVVAAADLRPEALRVLPHGVEDAAVERAAGPVADESIERP